MGTREPTLAEALDEALGSTDGEPILCVGLEPPSRLRGVAQRAVVGALPEASYGAVALGPTAEPLLPVLRDCARRVRDGGVMAVAVPIARDGVRAVTQRALSVFEPARRPRSLEEVCAALLSVGVSRVKVCRVHGVRGEAVVHGVLAPRVFVPQGSPA